MSYRINHYNGSLVVNLNDGTVDNTLDITLVGKNYAGYGTTQNENFVYLLENFANITPPPRPVSGQVWFDSGNKKLKFYDGSIFRTASGAEIGAEQPTGLTVGDFWFDTVNKQLHAYTGTGFALIGPQLVVGAGATEMLSTTVTDSIGEAHSVIQAINNGDVVFTISSDSDYDLDSTLSPIPGFSRIHKGVTLAYTNIGDTIEADQGGITQDDHRFWGTASNSLKLGGISADSFVQAGDANFSRTVNFADVGYTVGNPNPKLKVYNASDLYPTISNIWNEQINFSTTVGSNTKYTIQLNGTDVLPGTVDVSSLGSSDKKFNAVYAASFVGTATNANFLRAGSTGSTYVASSSSADGNSIVLRTATSEVIGGKTITAGSIKATFFVGTATAAEYADLAENYLADAEYPVGTVMMVGGEKEVTACMWGKRAIGVVSGNPAYLMNSELEGGTAIALKGRVPVMVHGSVKKGDELIASGNGCAVSAVPHANGVFAVALESNDDTGVKLVECLVL
jgi:hypothetical protein